MTSPLDRLRAKEAKATLGNLSTAEKRQIGDHFECPMCETEGYVDGETFTNYDQAAVGVQFFGIGDAYKANEEFYWAATNIARALCSPEAVEVVARAMCAFGGCDMSCCPDDGQTCRGDLSEYEMDRARAALNALAQMGERAGADG